MLLFQILLLAVIQGVTEFLPISSDGHLVLTQQVFKELGRPLPSFLLIEIVLHFGTLLSILLVYRKEILSLLSTHRRLIPLLILGTVPAGIIGLGLKKFAPVMLEDAYLAGLMLFVTGGVVFWSSMRRPGDRTLTDVNWIDALVIGFFQSLAVLPGLSRSGCTIASGIGRGLNRQAAADFSFLLAIPALCGACTLAVKDLIESPDLGVPIPILAIGALVSFAVGVFALNWLIAWLRSGKFYYFGVWCFIAGSLLLLWLTLFSGTAYETPSHAG